MVSQAELDACRGVGHLAGHELQATTGAFVIEKDPRAGVELVALPVIDRCPVAVHFGHAVWAAWVERGPLALRDFNDLAEHFRTTGLIEPYGRVQHHDGVQETSHTEGRHFPREYRLCPRGHYKGLGSQVVDLG